MTAEAKFVISASDKTKSAVKSVEKGLKEVSDKVFSLNSTIAGLVGAAGMGALIKSTIDAGDHLAKTADKIGISTKALAEMQYAGDLAGISSEKLADALEKTQKRAGQAAQGFGSAKQWLEKLNIDVRQFADLPVEQKVSVFADAIQHLTSRSEQLAAISDVMGDESRDMINLMELGLRFHRQGRQGSGRLRAGAEPGGCSEAGSGE